MWPWSRSMFCEFRVEPAAIHSKRNKVAILAKKIIVDGSLDCKYRPIHRLR